MSFSRIIKPCQRNVFENVEGAQVHRVVESSCSSHPTMFQIFRHEVKALQWASKIALCYVVLRIFKMWRHLSHNKHSDPRLGEEDGDPKDDPQFHNFTRNKQGLWLFSRKWIPDSSTVTKGIVFIVHGLGEHVGRYAYVAEYWRSKGFVVCGMDHQGHGQSEGDRMFVEQFRDLASDYLDFVYDVLQRKEMLKLEENEMAKLVDLQGLPRFIFGHSMGGAVTLSIVEVQCLRCGR